ncbi:MAG: hypothetical protein QM527_14595 [Alphaproteobacteria bacterium]|nr:hypothetical protein [Alphaproteobacteria bacterium]
MLQSALALLVLSVAIAAGIQLTLGWVRQSQAEVQAHQLLVVQSALQRFIHAYQPALLLNPDPSNPSFVPYVDADGDGMADAISYGAAGSSPIGVLNLPAASGGAALQLVRETTGLPLGVAHSWVFDLDVLQKTPVQWLKPGTYATLQGSNDNDIKVVLSVNAKNRRLRGVACLSAALLARGGTVNTQLLQDILAYRPADASGLASGMLAVSIDGTLRSAAGAIDPDLQQVNLPASVKGGSGAAQPGTVCAMVGEWPATLTAGATVPQRVTASAWNAADFDITSHWCAYPGELRWVYNNATPPVVQGLQRCSEPEYRWLLAPKDGQSCTGSVYTAYGRGPTEEQPVHLVCVNLGTGSTWQDSRTLRVAQVGDACTPPVPTPASSVDMQFVTSAGKILYCIQNRGTTTGTLQDTPMPDLSLSEAARGTDYVVYYVPTEASGATGTIGCGPGEPTPCLPGSDLRNGHACSPNNGIFLYHSNVGGIVTRRFGLCVSGAIEIYSLI